MPICIFRKISNLISPINIAIIFPEKWRIIKMKKLSTILIAAVFMLSAGASFAASSNPIADIQAKRDAAIKKQDAKLNELQKKQEAAQKKREADKAALQKKQEAYKKQQQAQKEAYQKKQQQRKDAVKNLKDSFKY